MLVPIRDWFLTGTGKLDPIMAQRLYVACSDLRKVIRLERGTRCSPSVRSSAPSLTAQEAQLTRSLKCCGAWPSGVPLSSTPSRLAPRARLRSVEERFAHAQIISP
jgi:hypothetical protein